MSPTSTILNYIILDLFSGFVGSVIGAIIGGIITWKATKFLIKEQEKPIFTLIFKITNKSLEAFPIKIGIKNLGGTAKDIKWYLKGNIPEENLYDKGDIPIMGRNESRYLLDLSYQAFLNIMKESKNFELVIEFFDRFGSKDKQEIPLSLYKMGDFEIATDANNREIIEVSKKLYQEAKKEFQSMFLKDKS